jgi:hypothetical protein
MDDAHKKLEIGLEQIYGHVRRPFERLHLKLAVTQNGLQPLPTTVSLAVFAVFAVFAEHVFWTANVKRISGTARANNTMYCWPS